MGRILSALVKTVLVVVITAGAFIASFYFAYLLLILLVMGVVGTLAWNFFNREERINWFKYEDTD
jgi:hypothetical protein